MKDSFSLPVLVISPFFFNEQIPDEKQHKGKRVNLGQEGIDFIKVEKTWRQGCETAGLPW